MTARPHPRDVRDEEIHPAVFVEVRRIHAHAGTRPAVGAVGHVRGKPGFLEAAPAVHEQKIRHRVVGDEKVHPSIIIYIRCHHAPSFAEMRRDSRFPADIRPRPVNTRNATSYSPPPRAPHDVAATGESRLFRHIRERAVAIVAIERITQRLRRTVEITLAAIHQIKVHPAVVIVIKKRAARPARLRQIFLRGLPCRVNPADPALRRRYLFKGIRRRRRSCPQKRKHRWTKRPRQHRQALEKSAPGKKRRLSMQATINHQPHYVQNHTALQKPSPILTTFEWKPRCPVRDTHQTANPCSFVDKYAMAGFESQREHLENALVTANTNIPSAHFESPPSPPAR